MNIALVSGNPHLPQVIGGVEVNTHKLAHELTARGHKVSVLAKLSARDWFGVLRVVNSRLIGSSVSVDRDLGYPVFRSRQPWNSIESLSRPTIAVVQNGAMIEFARAFDQIGVPSVAYLHGLAFESWWAKGIRIAADLPFRGVIANSRFTAERFESLYGIRAAILPPVFRREEYVTEGTERVVSFVNPVPVKGVDLALQIAVLCPEIPFCFVRGWPLGIRGEMKLRRDLRRVPNVSLVGPTPDMRVIYQTTKILLVPSQWEAETWGRVVTEAQFSGIPVIASKRGGLPEAVGPGGVLLGHDEPATLWAATLRELWEDERRYRQLSSAALEHSARPALDPDRLLSKLIVTLNEFVA